MNTADKDINITKSEEKISHLEWIEDILEKIYIKVKKIEIELQEINQKNKS